METLEDANTILKVISVINDDQTIKEIKWSSKTLETNQNNYKHLTEKLQAIPESFDILQKFNNKTTISTVKEMCEKNNLFLKKLGSTKFENQDKLEKLEKRNFEAEEKVKMLEQKLLSLKAKQTKIEKKREKILVFKLLTNTHFCYETKNVKGYVVGKTPENVKCFDLNPKKLSQKDITDALYATVQKVCNSSSLKRDNTEEGNEEKQ